MDDLSAIVTAINVARLTGGDPVEDVGTDCMNYLSAWLHAIGKDSPAKAWWHAKWDSPNVARALRLPRDREYAPYALAPFRLWRDDVGTPLVIAAYPCPSIRDTDWLGITDVLAWNPVNNRIFSLTEPSPHLFGAITDDAPTIYADPVAFFQAWMRRRAQQAVQIQMATQGQWLAKPVDRDPIPGALIVGNPDKVRWPVHEMPNTFHVVGAEPRAINRAILKSARVPRCLGEMRDA